MNSRIWALRPLLRAAVSRRVLSAAIGMVMLGLISVAPAQADCVGMCATVSGTVSAQGGSTSQLTGTEVTVTDSSSGVIAASTTTSSTGFYSLSVMPGTYDLTFHPPSGSGFGNAVARGQVVSGDRTINVTLVPANVGAISGVVRGNGGVALRDMTVRLTPQSGTGSIVTTTAADGSYSLTAAPGTYTLRVNGSRPSGVAASVMASNVTFEATLNLQGSVTQESDVAGACTDGADAALRATRSLASFFSAGFTWGAGRSVVRWRRGCRSRCRRQASTRRRTPTAS